ncbi:NUDIX hydrolase [Actinoplanes sp. NPDC000266]
MTIRYLTASAVVVDDHSGVLLVHHRKSGLWLYPGGHLEANESPAEAAVREVEQETGIQVSVVGTPRFTHPAIRSHPQPWTIIEMDVIDPKVGPHRHIDFLYVCHRTGGRLAPQLDEVADARWVPLDRLSELELPAEMPNLTAAALHWATTGRQPAARQ